jgi:hypothetical protein
LDEAQHARDFSATVSGCEEHFKPTVGIADTHKDDFVSRVSFKVVIPEIAEKFLGLGGENCLVVWTRECREFLFLWLAIPSRSEGGGRTYSWVRDVLWDVDV